MMLRSSSTFRHFFTSIQLPRPISRRTVSTSANHPAMCLLFLRTQTCPECPVREQRGFDRPFADDRTVLARTPERQGWLLHPERVCTAHVGRELRARWLHSQCTRSDRCRRLIAPANFASGALEREGVELAHSDPQKVLPQVPFAAKLIEIFTASATPVSMLTSTHAGPYQYLPVAVDDG